MCVYLLRYSAVWAKRWEGFELGGSGLQVFGWYYRSDSVAEGSEYAETGFIISEE
jgi:hypothetical protein